MWRTPAAQQKENFRSDSTLQVDCPDQQIAELQWSTGIRDGTKEACEKQPISVSTAGSQ